MAKISEIETKHKKSQWDNYYLYEENNKLTYICKFNENKEGPK